MSSGHCCGRARRTFGSALAALGTLSLSGSVWGQEPDLEGELSPEEMAEIEAAVGADAAASAEQGGAEEVGVDENPGVTGAAAAFLPDISLILDVALAVFSEDEHLQTGAHDPGGTGFNLQALELSMSKSVDPYLRFDSHIVLNDEEVELEEVYGTTLTMPWNLQARVGQFLTRFGRINSTHPHAWDFVDQPFAIGKAFGAEGNRGVGAELSVLLPLPWYVELLISTTNATGEESARSFMADADPDIESPLDFQHTGAAKQFFDLSPDVSLLWGLSAATGPNPSGPDERSNVYGTDLFFKYRPITYGSYEEVRVQLEALLRRRQVPGDVWTDAMGYAQVAWRLTKRFSTAWRYEYATPTRNDGGEVVVDTLDPEHVEDRHRLSSSFSFAPTEFSRIRTQGAVDLPQWRDEPVWAGFLTLELVAGSHGSHAF